MGMIGWQRSVATGVGERVEAVESLYLGWGPRYSCRKTKEGMRKIVMVKR
jgi:hypothetical protein